MEGHMRPNLNVSSERMFELQRQCNEIERADLQPQEYGRIDARDWLIVSAIIVAGILIILSAIMLAYAVVFNILIAGAFGFGVAVLMVMVVGDKVFGD